jgi:hypothetical protein
LFIPEKPGELLLDLRADNLAELKSHLANFGDKFLFRGQTNDYRLPDGSPNLTSSFVRKGCVPPLMLKWIFYTNELLRRGGVDVKRPDMLPLIQGLLQHYGWRSFFVDLSSSASVAAWFASHSFRAAARLHLCENTSEEPVMLKLLGAAYNDHEGTGHLSVLDKELLKKSNHSLISLEDELTTDCPSRFQTQKAWLAGIFLMQRRLDPAAIAAHVTAPSSVFMELAQSAGLKNTDDVFPGPEHDKLLGNLLDLPWTRIEAPNHPFPVYWRSLEIPEYQVSFVKHLPATTALYTPFWLSEIEPSAANEIWLHVPEETFYGSLPINEPLPRLSEYLRQNEITNIESKELICYPALPNNVTYQKGVSIRRKADNMFDVCGISVDYPSDQLAGGGVSEGYMYELVGSQLIRRPAPTDCSCDDPDRHDHHLRAVAILDDLLGTAKVERSGQVIQVSAL